MKRTLKRGVFNNHIVVSLAAFPILEPNGSIGGRQRTVRNLIAVALIGGQLFGFVPHTLGLIMIGGVTARSGTLWRMIPAVRITSFGSRIPTTHRIMARVQILAMDFGHPRETTRNGNRRLSQTIPVLHHEIVQTSSVGLELRRTIRTIAIVVATVNNGISTEVNAIATAIATVVVPAALVHNVRPRNDGISTVVTTIAIATVVVATGVHAVRLRRKRITVAVTIACSVVATIALSVAVTKEALDHVAVAVAVAVTIGSISVVVAIRIVIHVKIMELKLTGG
mmetsp:Transcript_834/g.978  ORF Transcript_834/g.978 Transcript_834/m.978 type:complete len:282 (-) Transcript_834:213-1058(-)